MFGAISNFLKIVLIVLFYQLCCTHAQSKYQIAPYDSNWFEASEYCHRMDMRLAIVDSEEKHNAVVKEAKAAKLHSSGFFGVWLGATDLARSGNFIWHNTGARLRYARWGEGEPSGGREHCVVLYYWPKQRFNWTWNDAPCSTELYAICENYEKAACIQEF
ncbi:AAEL012353-PA [Aedes aegypti]|uniref:AAEL012353-PA n=2 Tax=Aedes aegypti TaxID=7159 RepID=A0A1S4FWD4_AEDAE|nr:perlucin-like protein [Aedes aegypti]EAT35479.1 AAEL012353-PA [Aedes aegypti]